MKKIVIVVSVIALSFVGLIFFTNGNVNKDSSVKNEAVEIVDEKKTLKDEIKSVNGQLIDVREPSEYEVSHADGAINIPLGNILKADYSNIDSSRPIYLICRSGNRAGQAKTALEQAGFTNVKNIGGLVDWEKQGDKVCNTSAPSCS